MRHQRLEAGRGLTGTREGKMQTIDLDGKVVLITGASSGIGVLLS
jgi:NADPH:quinone reductase-like Zn-dependent oxidoreductase